MSCRCKIQNTYKVLDAKHNKYNEHNIFRFFTVIQKSHCYMIKLKGFLQDYINPNILKIKVGKKTHKYANMRGSYNFTRLRKLFKRKDTYMGSMDNRSYSKYIWL